MAEGDLVVSNYQYEFRGLLLGANTPFQIESIDGLLSVPEVTSRDSDRQDDHGAMPGKDLLKPRILNIRINALSSGGAASDTLVGYLNTVFQVSQVDRKFCFQRPGKAKRMVWARPRKCEFPANYDTSKGKASGGVQLVCADPVVYSLAEKTANIASGASSACVNDGDFDEGCWPTIEFSNTAAPRLTNAGDGGRVVRFDFDAFTGGPVIADTRWKRVTFAGADVYNVVRGDNQWWQIKPGSNLVSYAGGGSALVRWRDSYTSG